MHRETMCILARRLHLATPGHTWPHLARECFHLCDHSLQLIHTVSCNCMTRRNPLERNLKRGFAIKLYPLFIRFVGLCVIFLCVVIHQFVIVCKCL